MDQQQIQPNIPKQTQVSQKKNMPNWIVGLITVLVIVVIGLGGYFVYQLFSDEPEPELPINNREQPGMLPATNGENLAKNSDKWPTYTNEEHGFSIKYPSEWLIGENFFHGVGFGPEEIKEDLIWVVSIYDKSEKTISQIKDEMGKQFSDRKQNEETITVNGLTATKIITTTNEVENWYSVLIVIDNKDKLFSIGNAALTDDALNKVLSEATGDGYNISFEDFYSTFKFTN